MKTKQIEAVLTPPPAHWVGDGFKVHNFFPGTRIGIRRMSPFFLLDYNAKMTVPPSAQQRGVGAHPHRGFETVTIAYKGKVAHHDSTGNSGIIGEGDVQWMTAGAGILHKEYQEEAFSRAGGPFQMVQLWVNLPAKDKMTAPGYQALTAAEMGKVALPDNGGEIRIIAGSYEGTAGPARTFSPLNVYNAHLNAGGKASFSFPETDNTALLVIEGKVKVNGEAIAPENNFVLFKNEGTDFEIEGMDQSIVLVLSGEPINEPIAQYGPFLMNTQEQIQQAIVDFQYGQFGELE